MIKLSSVLKKRLPKINEFREKVGLKKLEIVIRECLKCGKKFESLGDRICKICKLKKLEDDYDDVV